MLPRATERGNGYVAAICSSAALTYRVVVLRQGVMSPALGENPWYTYGTTPGCALVGGSMCASTCAAFLGANF